MVAAMPLQNDARPSEKTVTLRDMRRVAFGLTAAIMIVMIAGAINDDSGSSTATVLEETSAKSFAAPVSLSGPTSTGTEDVAYSGTMTWHDTDGTDVSLACTSGCSSWITFTDGGGSANTATVTGTPLDAHVGVNTIVIQGTSDGQTTQVSYTITISEVNDEPTLTATGATGTFTEDGSNLALYSSAAAADSDSQATQTFTSLVLTVTNVADTTEYLVVNSGDCDLTNGNSETTTYNAADLVCAVSVTSGTATVTLTPAAGLTNALMQALIDGIAYKNVDQSPTAGNRVVTITTMTDNGGTAGAGDDSVTVAIAATVTVAAAPDDPVIANSDNTGAVTEAVADTTDTAADTLVVTDADGETVTWACSSCNDAGDTQTLTGTYGSWVLTEASGAWAYTLNNADTDTDQLDAGDQVTDTLTATATDSSGATDSITVTVTVNGANDAPTTSTPSAQSGTEDTVFTGYTISDFPFADVDDADSALTSITITVLESSGTLTKSTNGVDWTDVSANDVILSAHITHLKLLPASNSIADVTFTYTVQDGATSSGAAVMTTSFAAANDVPTWSVSAADVTTDEDVAKTITGSAIADVDDTSLELMSISSTQGGTFSLASVSGLSFGCGSCSGDGVADSSMAFSGTVANINTAIATITWTSAANVNTNAVLSLTANDGDGDSVTDQVTITVNAVQDLPTTSDGAATIAEDDTHTFTTTPGDWGYADVDSDSLASVDITTLPATGTLRYGGSDVIAGADIAVGNLGGLTYVPVANANGVVTFTFKVNDGTAWSENAGQFSMTYTAVNDAPTASTDTRVVVEDTQTAFTSSDIADAYADIDGDSISRIQITVLESAGDLECQNANGVSDSWQDCVANDYVDASTDLRFTTDTNAVADVTFSFKVHDGTAYSAAAYVFTITVTAVNDAPSNAGDTATASEDVAYAGWTAAGDWGYSDVDSDTMISITLKSLPSQGTLTSTNNACGGDNTCAIDDVVLLTKLAAGDLKYTGASNYNGADTFTYTVEDSALSSSTGTMTMTVSAVNDAPVAGDTSDQTVFEDLAFSFQTAQSTDVDGDTMTITCIETGSDMPAFLSETADSGGQATLGGTATAAALTLATSGNDNTYAMTCTTEDPSGLTATDTFVVTVTAVNDAPVLSSDGSGVADEGTVVEDAAFSVTLTATDEESADVTFAKNSAGSCPTWITLSDAGAGQQTATLAAANTATIDARVGDNTCDLTLSDGTNTILETYTLTITQKNDEPTVSATTATPTFTEDGSAVSIYSSSAVADSDAQETQTFTSLVVTITNVADTTEYLVVNGGECDLTNGNSETTTISSSDLTCAVAVAGNPATATVTITHAGLTAAQMQTLIDGLKYTNSDQSPTAGNRVITITTMTDSGGTSNSGDNSVTVAIASTVTAEAADDDPVIANSDNTGAVTEAVADTTDTAADTLVVTDADGEAVTWSCTGCNDGGATQTLTDVYGSWVLTEASGAWTYTLNNADTDTDVLDGGDSVQETIVMVAADASGGNTDSITVTITITGANDLPTSSATTTAGAEDTTLTFQTSDFSFSDVDGDDSAASAFKITTLESSGDLECFDGSAWADCEADDIVSSAAHIRISPVAGETPADVTFSYKVSDGTGYSSAAYVKTIDFAAVNDAPVNTMGADVTTNEDVAKAITGTSIADSDSTSMTSVAITASRGTFSLAQITDLTFAAGDGTADATMTFSGTVTNINSAIATLTWTSASNDNTDATITMVTNDGAATDTDSLAITVSAVNDLPTTDTPSTQAGTEDTVFTGYATSDFPFTDVDGDSITSITITVVESSGNLEKSEDGSSYDAVSANDVILADDIQHLKLTPATDSVASVTFTYTVQDGSGGTDSAVMTTSFAAVNDNPVNTMGTPAAVNEDVALAITGTSIADVDDTSMTSVKLTADRGTFTLATSSATYAVGTQGTPASTVTIGGTVSDINVALAAITWTSASNDNANAVITMVTTDDEGGADTDTMSITVNAVNDLPTTDTPDTQAGTEDTVFTGYTTSDFPFTDVDGDSITSITITVVESSGNLEKSEDGSSYDAVSANDVILADDIQHLKLTPATDSVASVTFTYTVQDGSGGTDSAVMTTSFAAVNDNPVNTMGTPAAVNEDVALAITGTSIADVDDTSMTSVKLTADRGTFTLATSSATYAVGTQGTPASTVTIGGTVSDINVALATITWTSASNDNANAVITMVTTDDEGGADTDTMSITVNAVNDLPTSTDFTVTTNEDTSHTFAASEFGFADVDSGDSLASATLQAASAGQLWVDADSSGSMDNGEAVVANGDTITTSNLAKLMWLPATNANGATYGTFTYTLNDGTGNSASSYTATLAVTAVDDVPVCSAGSAQSVAEGATVTLDATGSTDVEGATITYLWSIASGTTQTLSSTTDAGPTFTAAQALTGYTTTVQVICTASGAAGSAVTAVITVSADNDAPTAEAGPAQTVAEGASVQLTAAGSSDPESQTLAYTWTHTSGTAQTLTGATTATPTFTAVEGLAEYTSTFQVSVTDGTTAVTDTVVITVTADNDAPTAEAGPAQTVAEGASVTLTAAGSSDPEGQTLSYTWSLLTGATQTLSATNVAAPTFTAIEGLAEYSSTFQVSVTDGTTADTDTVVITVTADNDAPTA
ncbi:Ig-like domain-containing protein, partial [Euryarchaeota archaeon]|nr:Ig-like domain-containing protein [Euryarchaeota archaeon]